MLINKCFYSRIEDTDELLSVIVQLQQLENFVWIINERALITNSSALFDGKKLFLNKLKFIFFVFI